MIAIETLQIFKVQALAYAIHSHFSFGDNNFPLPKAIGGG